jgi:hypothetical protein
MAASETTALSNATASHVLCEVLRGAGHPVMDSLGAGQPLPARRQSAYSLLSPERLLVVVVHLLILDLWCQVEPARRETGTLQTCKRQQCASPPAE